MKPFELQTILSREYSEFGRHVPVTITPEARFVTGNARHDAQIHRILVEYGIELDLNQSDSNHWRYIIQNYRIVDKKKFMWFLLRWS